METNRLNQFCTIVETGNLRKAANLLGISHSGLSKSMKALEAEMGFPLFHPSGRGIVISDGGMTLYRRSASFFAELKLLRGQPEEKNIIRMGSFEVFTTFFMGRLLKDYLSDMELEIHELVPGRLEEALLLNKVDIGITYEPIPRRGIEYVKVKTLTMGAFVAEENFKDQKVLEVPFVVPVSPLEGAPSGVKGRDGWPDERFKRIIRYRVDLMTTGLELTRLGLCAIFIPQFVADLHNQSAPENFKLRPLDLPRNMGHVKRDVFIVKRESTTEDRVIQQVAKALRNLT